MTTEAQEVHTVHLNQTQIQDPDLATILSLLSAVVSSQTALRGILQQQGIQLLTLLDEVAALKTATPVIGTFNPPLSLMRVVKMEIPMSVMQLEVGQTAVGMLTFDEMAPPADGAVMSDNPAVATISLDADKVTWHCEAMSVGTANISYTGTSAAPDVGAAIVPNMVVTVVAVPVAEHGDFNPTGATITGP